MSSPKSDQSNQLSEGDIMEDASDSGNGLMLAGPPFGLEKTFDYESGGHHPVHLGDMLGPEGRYKVIHKLGSGGFGNVWLCCDTSSDELSYVACKILMADYSNDECQELRVCRLKDLGIDESPRGRHICLPLDNFRINGPNGSHLCFIYPVLGPRVSKSTEGGEAKQRLMLQTTQAMAALHERGICHGDFAPSNVLLRLAALNGLAEETVIQALGKPRRTDVTTYSGEPSLVPSAPKYLVYPVDFDKFGSQFITSEACVIDFGESFEATEPPEDLGTPRSYCSPELLINYAAGVASDLWALGCTLFEIRTSRKLFDTFDNEVDDYLYAIVLLLGKLPEL